MATWHFGSSAKARVWKPSEDGWKTLIRKCENPADKKDCGGYVAAAFKGTRRLKTDVLERWAITLDADSARASLPSDVEDLGIEAVIHTTFSSTPDKLRYRVIIPLTSAMTPKDYTAVANGLIHTLGRDQFDMGSIQAERLMFWPSYNPGQPDDAYEWYWVNEGKTADPEDLIAVFYKAPEGPARFVDHTSPESPRDPYSLPGVVGAFNRVYDFWDAVEKFDLPYEDREDGRIHLVGAKSVSGIVELQPGVYYSHHAKDPAYGMACSVFDIVAAHKYPELAKDVAPGTPLNLRPAAKAFEQDCQKDKTVMRELLGDAFADLTEEGENLSWIAALDRHPKTGKATVCAENIRLLRDNDPVLSQLAHNELTMTSVVVGDLPWRKVRPGITDIFTEGDLSELELYLALKYNMELMGQRRIITLVEAQYQTRKFHPIREAIENTVWDGTPRLETCWPGVAHNEYTRMAARRVMCGAVARLFEPGTKTDFMPILQGGEGLGKSWWIQRMALGGFTDLGAIGSKDTTLKLMRSWIAVADEGFALRKSDADAFKEFVTRTHDIVRLPYGRTTGAYPRQYVIWGAVNDEVFLRRQEGNRRYLVIEVEDKCDFERYSEEYVLQIWAEAKVLWERGERLYLDDHDSQLAAAAREPHLEEDTLAGAVEKFLSTPVPADWEQMSTSERKIFLANADEGLDQGVKYIEYVCSADILELVMGVQYGRHSRIELMEAGRAIQRVPGWENSESLSRRTKNYGRQRMRRRKNVPEVLPADLGNAEGQSPENLVEDEKISFRVETQDSGVLVSTTSGETNSRITERTESREDQLRV